MLASCASNTVAGARRSFATGTLTVIIEQMPIGAPVAITLSSARGFYRALSAAGTITGLPPGTYSLTAADVIVNGNRYSPSPATQSIVVPVATPITASIGYAAVTGTLQITVAGIPRAIAAALSLVGPDGFNRFLPGPVTLTGLTPGNYTLEAGRLSTDGTIFAPRPDSQVLNVTAGEIATANIVYSAGARSSRSRELVPGFQPRQMLVMGQTYKYQVFVPEGYTALRPWPVILFIHGSGERGSDGSLQTTVGLGPYVKAHALTFPAIVVLPQQPVTSEVSFGVAQLLDSVIKTALHNTLAEVNADSSRIYMTGISAGAFRSYEVGYQLPGLFAASVPIAGGLCPKCIAGDGAMTAQQVGAFIAQRLKDLPIWAFHGSLDRNAPVANDRVLIQAFRDAGSAIKYTEYPGIGHNAWDVTYADPALWAWLFEQHK